LIAAWVLSAESRWRSLALGVFILGTLGLLFTFSRSAWLAFAGAGGVMAILLLRTRQAGALQGWLSLAGAALVVLVPFLWQNAAYIGIRLNWQNSFQEVPNENQSIGERQLLNQAANHIFAQAPFTGVGLGAFPLALRQEYPELPVSYQPAHFVLLDAAAETGIFGALFYILTLVAPWLALWRRRDRLVFSPALVGVSALLFAVSAIGLFDYYTWLLAPGRLLQWLAWGLWGAVYTASLGEA
jgi:O-antigen ligase